MKKTKIEWCDSTWNPITGCYHECEYCYARRIAKRFGGNDKLSTFRPFQCDWRRADGNKDLFYDKASREKPMLFVIDKPLFLPSRLDKRKTEKYGRQIFENKKAPYPFDFNPTFHKYRLDEPERWTKPRTIFVCSMADLFGEWVPDSWIDEIFAACEKAPQHKYLFLTKNVERYVGHGVPLGENMWYGTTVTKREDVDRFNDLPACGNTFISIEPLLEDIEPGKHNIMFRQVDWFIIGAETGRRKGKIAPERKWIEDIVNECDKYGKPVFMKNSLVPIVGEENMRREFPWRKETNNE